MLPSFVMLDRATYSYLLGEENDVPVLDTHLYPCSLAKHYEALSSSAENIST